MTRVARLDEDMWTELFLDDADYLVKELDILIENLTAYSQALKSGDAERVRALLREGRFFCGLEGGGMCMKRLWTGVEKDAIMEQ